MLLILAGVAISMLSGDNGILNKAVQAKDATRGGEVQETVALEAANNVGAEYLGGTKKTRPQVISELHANGKLTDAEVATLEENDVITIGGITIDFSVLGPISNAKTLVQAFKDREINVGDYITNYNSTLNNSNATASLTTEETGFDGGTQTYKVNTTTTWRVLGLNKDETQLVITTGSPIKKEMDSSATEDWKKDPYLYLDKAEGWYNTNDELVSNNILDKVCAIYAGRYATDTKSMRIEDINTALGLTLDKTVAGGKLYKTADESKTALTAYQGFFGQSYTYKTNDYAPENYLKAKYPSNVFGGNSGKYNGFWSSNESNLTTLTTSGTVTSNNNFLFTKLSNVDNTNMNYKAVATLLDSSKWSSLANTAFVDNTSTSVIGSPTVEMWMASWNQKYTDTLAFDANTYGYRVGLTEGSLNTYIRSTAMQAKQGFKDSLYYPHGNTSRNSWNDCYGYWLASPVPAVGDTGNVMYVFCNGYVSSTNYNYSNLGVRPVVSLSSGIKGTATTTDGITTWNISK